MRVQVRLFATLREARGAELVEVELPEGTTAAGAFAALFDLPGLRVGYAVNTAFVSPDTPLHEGDELALLPPLGGG